MAGQQDAAVVTCMKCIRKSPRDSPIYKDSSHDLLISPDLLLVQWLDVGV